ncbi:hypothetical protein EYF80_057724 [Liparis tanakae]|uniref:Uncharacterized protein n=1 Tax=Liparis tanakae TaxID=230148 RepID=A0A4Z2ET66_9TELE|nr:hypothetical protein EYF80_057724 [Liparis tanakae]
MRLNRNLKDRVKTKENHVPQSGVLVQNQPISSSKGRSASNAFLLDKVGMEEAQNNNVNTPTNAPRRCSNAPPVIIEETAKQHVETPPTSFHTDSRCDFVNFGASDLGVNPDRPSVDPSAGTRAAAGGAYLRRFVPDPVNPRRPRGSEVTRRSFVLHRFTLE